MLDAMEIFNNIFIKIISALISVAFLIYFIQLFDGFHKIMESVRTKLGRNKTISVDELGEFDRIRSMNEELNRMPEEKEKNKT